MASLNSILGLIVLVTLLTGIVSGIVLAPKVSEPFSDVESLVQGLDSSFVELGVLCKKKVYKNDTLDLEDLESLEVIVRSGKAMIVDGEPRIVVYTLEGVFCNLNPDKPKWDFQVEDGSVVLELREGVVELYIPAEQLELVNIRVESGVVDVDLSNMHNLEVSEIHVASGVANVDLSGLASLYNYTIDVESGIANVDLDFDESSEGYLYVNVASGQLNLDLKGDVNACLESSRVTSGLARIDLPEKCRQEPLRVYVNVFSGIASIE